MGIKMHIIRGMSKNVYIKCPRCELNFIQKKDKFCPVCKQEMQALSTNYTEDLTKMGLCPICKVNYITDDENVCGTCVGESELTEEELDALYGSVVSDKETDENDEVTDDEDELELISIDMDEGEGDEDMMDEEEGSDPLDDLDETLDDIEDGEDDEDDLV